MPSPTGSRYLLTLCTSSLTVCMLVVPRSLLPLLLRICPPGLARYASIFVRPMGDHRAPMLPRSLTTA